MKKIHFVGIGGVGTGSFAVALAEAGYEITGSDGALYEPMKSVLASSKIQLIEGFKEETPSELSPDAVIIGNVVRKENPEVVAWMKKGTRFFSFPEAVRVLLLEDNKSIVCAGTHGKTSTTSWISFLLSELQQDPTYLIGGVPLDLPRGCKKGKGPFCVVEGDEYDSAFFDKGPKFLHYNPSIAVISSIEFDHADIYKDLDHVKASFEKLVSLLPGDGLCVARFDDPVVMAVAPLSLSPVQSFGMGAGAMWRVGQIDETEEGFNFEILYKGKSVGRFQTPMFGEHNLMNLLSGIVVATNLGFSVEKIRPIVPKFRGARRRQEILSRKPVTLVDDFAHHPTEVAATLSAVRRRYKTGKLFALFEPRSATARRSVHQEAYENAFDCADHVYVSIPYRATELKEGERLSSDALVESLKKRGKSAQSFDTVEHIVESVGSQFQPGDVVVVMSNGEFGKIQGKLLERLQ